MNTEQSEQSEQCQRDVTRLSVQYPAEDGSILDLTAASRLISDKKKEKKEDRNM